MSDFSKALAVYIDAMANPKSGISDEHRAAESLCNAIETKAQAQIAFDSLDDAERIMGNYVADNAISDFIAPEESAGIAALYLDDGFAIVASWDSQGFWYVTFETIADSETMVDDMAAEYAPEEEEEEEEEDG